MAFIRSYNSARKYLASTILTIMAFFPNAASAQLLNSQQAYVAYEHSASLSCNLAGPQFSGDQAYLNFVLTHHFKDIDHAIEISAPSSVVQSSMSLDGNPFTLSLNLTARDQTSLNYTLSVNGNDYDATSVSGVLSDPDFKYHIQVSRAKRPIVTLECWTNHFGDYQFTQSDLTMPVHFVVHPIVAYDYRHDGFLARKVDPLLNDPRIRSVILIESVDGLKPLNAIMNGLPEIKIDPQLTVHPSAATDFREAYNGTINFHAFHGQLPSKMILTGGFFNACMTHMLDGFFEELRNAQTPLVQIAMPVNAVFIQEGGEFSIPLPQGFIDGGFTLSDLRQKDPKAFVVLLNQFLHYHISAWQDEERALPTIFPEISKKDVTMSFIDSTGAIVATESTNNGGTQRVAVKFNLVND